MSGYTTIRVDVVGPLANVTLARPDVHNAFNDIVIAEVTTAFAELGANKELRAIVLAGEGKSFSAGADLGWMKSMIDYTADENVSDARRMAGMFRTIDRCPIPVIARVQGAAIGGGAGLVAASDIAIADDSTKFAFSETRLGIIPAVISPFVIDRIGAAHARRYFVTGERFSADRAEAIGLISESVPAAELDARVQFVVDSIGKCGPEAVAAAKQLVFDVTESPDFDTALTLTADGIARRRASAEGQDGMRAFLEKRKPRWVEPSS